MSPPAVDQRFLQHVMGVSFAPRLVSGKKEKTPAAGFEPGLPGFGGRLMVHAAGIAVSQEEAKQAMVFVCGGAAEKWLAVPS